jgi:hypothetical protein
MHGDSVAAVAVPGVSRGMTPVRAE